MEAYLREQILAAMSVFHLSLQTHALSFSFHPVKLTLWDALVGSQLPVGLCQRAGPAEEWSREGRVKCEVGHSFPPLTITINPLPESSCKSIFST